VDVEVPMLVFVMQATYLTLEMAVSVVNVQSALPSLQAMSYLVVLVKQANTVM